MTDEQEKEPTSDVDQRFIEGQERLLKLREADQNRIKHQGRRTVGPSWGSDGHPPDDLETFTEAELAVIMKVTKQTISNWRKQKIGPPFFKTGHCVRYSKSEFIAWRSQKMTGSSLI
jgi:hypothetical protein